MRSSLFFIHDSVRRLGGLAFGVVCSLSIFCLPAHAVRFWIASGDGIWRDANNWSGNVVPNSGGSVVINNTNTETITIDAPTLAVNLTIPTLTLSAPPGFTNTLYLNNVTNGPLICNVGFDMQSGAVLRLTNSSLLLPLINAHVNIDGLMELDGGSITFGDNTVTARVGRATSGTLVINSGAISAGVVTVGGLGNTSGTIAQNGGTFNISDFFSIARSAGTTGTVAVLGGQLTASNVTTRIGDAGIGQMTISNASVVLTNTDIARDGLTLGTLKLQTGGVATFLGDVSIGRFAGSTGNVYVTGGQLNASGQKISVGEGGNGQLVLSNGLVQTDILLVAADLTNTANGVLSVPGGSVNVTTSLMVGSRTYSSGQALVSGGALTVTNLGGTGMVMVANGSLTLNSGTITADKVLLTNTTGQFVFNGGTLKTKSTAITNGLPFVVGNGVAAATLYLNGGTHSFANGILISSNATLAGCGAILGPVVNHGTIATNCGGILIQPLISSVVRTGVTNTISFTSVLNQTYTLEYKNRLTDLAWTPLPPVQPGSGGVLRLLDTGATNSTRFYHVRTQ